MVVGVGVDLVDIARFERALERTPKLRNRLFGPLDVSQPDISSQSLAARFAAKEAGIKALGGNIPGFSWHDIQIQGARGEQQRLVLSGGASEHASAQGIVSHHVSLSHDAGMAIAFVVMEDAS